MSRGLLSGSAPSARGDFRAHLPRFTGENRERNEQLIERLRRLAGDKHATPTQLAIAWVLAKGERIVPVIGARTRAQLAESLGALDVTLSAADLAQIEDAISRPRWPAAGTATSRCGCRQRA